MPSIWLLLDRHLHFDLNLNYNYTFFLLLYNLIYYIKLDSYIYKTTITSKFGSLEK